MRKRYSEKTAKKMCRSYNLAALSGFLTCALAVNFIYAIISFTINLNADSATSTVQQASSYPSLLDGFSVKFPVSPAVEYGTIDDGVGGVVPMRTYSAETSNGKQTEEYFVIVYDFKDSIISEADPRVIIDNMIPTQFSNVALESFENNSNHDFLGHTGAKGTASADGVSAEFRVVIRDSKMYFITYATSGAIEAGAHRSSFMNSFKFR